MVGKLRIVAVIAAGIAAGLLIAWKLQPERRSASQQILEALADIQEGVEAKDVGDVMRHVSESYKDSTVENKRELIRLAQSGFYEKGVIRCQLQVAQAPDVRGDHATVDVSVDFGIERGAQVATLKPFIVHTEWARERKGWKVVRAEGYMQGEGAYGEGGF